MPETEVEYEKKHVHEVYENIAGHFSSTRYKPWPVVDDFLRQLPAGSVGLDIGCGNGKYLPVNKQVFIIASDRSNALVQIARQHQPHSAVLADILNLPHPDRSFDFAIAIAVLHHLSSQPRRTQAVKEILKLLKPSRSNNSNKAGGQALIFVWALEQKDSRRGWDRGDDQDVLVPWVLKNSHNSKSQPALAGKPKDATDSSSSPSPSTHQRYYHLYRQGELQADVVAAGGKIIREGYDRDNWWVIIARQD